MGVAVFSSVKAVYIVTEDSAVLQPFCTHVHSAAA